MKPKEATKCIGYSYPFSPRAKQLGRESAGCWTLEIAIDGKAELQAYQTFAEARQAFDQVPAKVPFWSITRFEDSFDLED